MDYVPYRDRLDPHDWHEKALLAELEDLPLVYLCQPRWFKREVSGVRTEAKHIRNRRKADKNARKREDIMKDMDTNADIGVDEDVAAAPLEDEEDAAKDDDTLEGVAEEDEHTTAVPEKGPKAPVVFEKKPIVFDRSAFLTENEVHKEEERLQLHWNTTLLQKAALGQLEDVEDALENGAEIDFIGAGGLSAAHLAAHHGNMKILSLLISKGADMNVTNGQRYSVFQHCLNSVKNGSGATQQTLGFLKVHGADIPRSAKVQHHRDALFQDWTERMDKIAARKRLEQARGRSPTRSSSKPKKEGSSSRSKGRSESKGKKAKKKKKKKE